MTFYRVSKLPYIRRRQLIKAMKMYVNHNRYLVKDKLYFNYDFTGRIIHSLA